MKNLIIIIIFYFVSIYSFTQIIPGAYQTQDYLPLLENKKVGIVSNQSSLIGNTHLVDSLLSLGVQIEKVFAPEHGFRGNAEAGAHISDGRDHKTQLHIISLYGKNKKPSKEQLKGIDIMIFDIQGVGARFYTYISTLANIMESCAEQHIPLIVLDRPNPNAHYIDGPVLNMNYASFVGMFPIPVVYGMTDGELAQMINGENWLTNGMNCNLTIIKMKNYSHNSSYDLPVKPSPNLPNFQSVYLYPSLCFFEGTTVSIGRGTEMPFQIIGYPKYPDQEFSFTPHSISGVSENPKFENTKCFGINLSNLYSEIDYKPQQLEIKWLLEFYQSFEPKNEFFNPFFEKLAGNGELRKQIEDGWSEQQIRESWQDDLEAFKKLRVKYLIYN